jgi:hypothetical protein
MNKATVFICATAALFSGCAAAPRLPEGRKGCLVLKDFAPQRGGHCESSAMLNALHHLGYGVTEADIVGGGGAPGFLFTDEGFPFIGGRSERMREDFLEAAGIPYKVVRPESGEDGWTRIIGLLDSGLPVLLRVDMRYLPYLFGGRYGDARMSFGWHWICLYSIDFDKKEALVTDTDKGGPCRVSLADLEKARSSDTKIYPPRREYAWIEPKPADWSFDVDKVTRSSFALLLSNYEGSKDWQAGGQSSARPGAPQILRGLSGLEAFPSRLAFLHTEVKPFLLGPAWSFMAASIERNGTGGAAFRRLYRDFIAARAADCADPKLRADCAAILPKAEAAATAWSAVAASFDEGAAKLAAARGSDRQEAILVAEKGMAECARELYDREAALESAIAATGGQ